MAIVRFLLSVSAVLLSHLTLHAESIVRVSNNYAVGYIGRSVDVFQDTTNRITIRDIIDGSTSFELSNAIVPNLGVNDYNNWVKFTIVNDSDSPHLILNITNPTIDELTLYTVRDGAIDSVSIDILEPYSKSERVYNHQFSTFSLQIGKGDSLTCYLKLNSTKQLLIPITISDNKGTVSAITGFDLRAGIYVGIMLAMLFYNLFLFFSARDRHYLVYVHYIFWVTVAQVAILGYFPRFFQSDILSNIHLLTFAGAMSGIASVIFVKSFLNTERYVPKLNKWLNTIIVGDLAAIALLFLNKPLWSYEIVNFVAGLGSVIVLIVGYITYERGNQSAKLFLLAWGIFLLSVIIYVLKDYGILNYNLFTVHAVQIGASLEALLLSFALGDKINIYRKEKEESQARALMMSQENEQLIREQNVILEHKVDERTRALTESNESLQTALIDLKETQSQLVEAEKMASLGQLTAGVAHEINNPINFVTSNVAPLKRDIGIMWQVIDEVEKVGLSDSPVDEKKNQIAAVKEELDVDYLKIEIDFLLKGMHEGASRTAEIVKSLRIFSRVDEDALKYADINEGLESTLVILNSVVKDSVQVVKEYSDLPLLECYPGKLNQVFLNIITNAIYAINKKYEGKDGGVLIIKTAMDSTHIYITIQDNGIGMSKQVVEKVFEPFFTTKEVGEGTGLGMSIVYNTIKKHQGEIKIDSTEGEGTAFELAIPLQQNTQ